MRGGAPSAAYRPFEIGWAQSVTVARIPRSAGPDQVRSRSARPTPARLLARLHEQHRQERDRGAPHGRGKADDELSAGARHRVLRPRRPGRRASATQNRSGSVVSVCSCMSRRDRVVGRDLVLRRAARGSRCSAVTPGDLRRPPGRPGSRDGSSMPAGSVTPPVVSPPEAAPVAIALQLGLHEGVEVTVEDGPGVRRLVLGAEVLDHLVGVEDVAPDLVAPAGLDVLALELPQLRLLLLERPLQEPRLEDLDRRLLVLGLATARSGSGPRSRSAGGSAGRPSRSC